MSKGHTAPALHTTTIDAGRTAAEIVEYLAKHGAASVATDYDAGRPRAVKFRIDTGTHGYQDFRLPVDVAAMEKHLNRLWRAGDLAPRYASAEQAERVAWRLVKQWLISQMSMVEAQQTTLAQTMLPFLLVGPDETVYDRFVTSGLRELEAGPVHDGEVVGRG